MLTPTIVSLILPMGLLPPSGTCSTGCTLTSIPSKSYCHNYFLRRPGLPLVCMSTREGSAMVKAHSTRSGDELRINLPICAGQAFAGCVVSFISGATSCCDGIGLGHESHLHMLAEAMRLDDADQVPCSCRTRCRLFRCFLVQPCVGKPIWHASTL